MTESELARLCQSAQGAMGHALAPHSGFRVGAALMDDQGHLHTGCNIENPSLMLTLCAERVALYKALSEGARSFKAIAIAAHTQEPCPPCGSCRQLLWEYAPELEVALIWREGVEVLSIAELLPRPFIKS